AINRCCHLVVMGCGVCVSCVTKTILRLNMLKRVLSVARPSVIWGGIVSLFFSSSAFAADAGDGGISVAEVIAAIKAAAGPIGSIGVAVLSVTVVLHVYKWIRRAF
uniref:major capsid protein n=2 Tax=Xylella fastidiosa TaxID=2371 RepID=UPI00200A4226